MANESDKTAPQRKKKIDKARGDDIKTHPGAAPLGTDAEAGDGEQAWEGLKIARRVSRKPEDEKD